MATDDPDERFSEDLVGLDPDDPEARAFAEHLNRMERSGPSFTVEASLEGIADFAESSNRLGGRWRLVAAVVATLIVFGVLLAAWETLGRFAQWIAG